MLTLAAAPALMALVLSYQPGTGSPPVPPTSFVATQLITLTPAPAKMRAAVFAPVPTIARREPRIVCGMTIIPPVAGLSFPMRVERPATGLKFHMRVLDSDTCTDW